MAFKHGGPEMQALVNCNIVLILVWSIITAHEITPDMIAVCAAALMYVLLGAFISFYKPPSAQSNSLIQKEVDANP